jgi:general secretion pathway protein K
MNRRDRGYAMLTAVAAIAAFAYIAFEVMAANRGAIIGLSAQVDRARMAAAADAGVMLAIEGVAIPDASRRWPIDGRSQAVSFDGMGLVITVEDERGKVPINRISPGQARRLFIAGGASGGQLEQLVAAFEDWQDDDDEPGPGGAERDDYRTTGIRPRNGEFRTVAELSRLKGMDPQVYARIAPICTVFFGQSGGFSARTASPAAIAVMIGSGENSPDIIIRQRELAGQRTALDTVDEDLRGRPMTVRVAVSDGRGGQFSRSAIVELTGNRSNPYWIRYLE